MLDEYYQLFTHPMLFYVVKGTIILSFISVYMANIRDIHLDLLKSNYNEKNYIYYKKNFELCVWALWQFAVCLFLVLINHFIKLARIFHVLFILILSSLFMILIPSIQEHYNILVGFANCITYYYLMITYLYFSELTLTKLRNASTSLLYLFISLSLLIQIFLVKSMVNIYIFTTVIFNCFLLIGFGLYEFFLLTVDTKNLGLHELELMILRKEKLT